MLRRKNLFTFKNQDLQSSDIDESITSDSDHHYNTELYDSPIKIGWLE